MELKNQLKKIGRWAWEMFKDCIPSMFVYFCVGTILILFTMEGEEIVWKDSKIVWVTGCALAAMAYNGLMMHLCGGNHYEMLVSGNVKRGGGYKISAHKEAKEFRMWKGFVIGAYLALFPLITGLVFGFNQTAIDTGTTGDSLNMGILTGFLFSGWSILLPYYLNVTGTASVNYFVTCACAVFPVIVSGLCYIWGAYARRNKTIKEQELKDRELQAEAQKEKKINYGGLPGTKPNKRK